MMSRDFHDLTAKKTLRVLGLMSGTSADGLDMCLVEFSGDDHYPAYKVLADHFVPYPEEFGIFRDPLEMSPQKIAKMNMVLGRWYGKTVRESGLKADILANHGQTLLHDPPGYTVQIGEASATAYEAGIPVVHDFRTADVMLGGQGAPLIPIVDDYLLRNPEHSVVALNMGGIANMTCLPPRGSDMKILAWDTGPANTLIDKCVDLYTEGEKKYDDGGRLARGGDVNEDLLTYLMTHSYFGLSLPKSAGQEEFGRGYLKSIFSRFNPGTDSEWQSLIRTVTEMTVRSIAGDVKKMDKIYGFSTLYASGGGAANTFIMERLAEELPSVDVKILAMPGINKDNKEAFGFAYLGYLFVKGLYGNVTTVTGASQKAVLGRICFNPAAGSAQKA